MENFPYIFIWIVLSKIGGYNFNQKSDADDPLETLCIIPNLNMLLFRKKQKGLKVIVVYLPLALNP